MSVSAGIRPDSVRFGAKQVVLRLGWFSFRAPLRGVLVGGALVLIAVAIALVSLATGAYPLSLDQVVGALTGSQSGIVHTIVVEWRLPRVLVAGLFGLALGLSGALFQSLTRNPLGSPDIIGFDTGAYTGALLVMLVLHSSGIYSTTIGALGGGLATAAVVYVLAWRRGVHGFRLIIVGIGVTAMLTSFNTWLLLSASTQDAISASYWGAGSLDSASYSQLAPAAGILIVLFIVTGGLTRGMRALELGDDAGRQLGTRAEATRLGLVIVGVALSATVTALSGPIAFVALSAPQIARRLCGSASIPLAPSAAAGCVLVLAADWIAQHAFPDELPVGLVTVVLGGGYFIWLLIAEGRRR
ncbi:MAG TPA: iron chelate uptake ABC transporter family permease subunit [Humibacter sp.]|nr:iron chelate uptake ABC transporter family permease subunit [Humibacter sp.]